METNPYTLHIPDTDLAALRGRIHATRWPLADPGLDEDWGLPQAYAEDLARYWADEFDWRAQERRINEVPQFTAEVDGHELHWFHARPDDPDAAATPLLLLHGWPGSSVEFLPMVPALVDPPEGSPAFEVVVPSLPGFGIPGPTRGWDADRVARALLELMSRLGHERFMVHGYDFGSIIGRKMAVAAPERVALLHVTQVLQGERLTSETAHEDDPWEQRVLAAGQRYDWQLSGYATVQSTRPQPLGYALTDSPVGLMAWLVDGFRAWAAEPDALGRDSMLTTVSLFWFFGTIASSIRYYRSGAAEWGAGLTRCRAPLAVTAMPDDIGLPVRRLVEQHHQLVRWNVLPRGGHFAGWEQPTLMVEELRAAWQARPQA